MHMRSHLRGLEYKVSLQGVGLVASHFSHTLEVALKVVGRGIVMPHNYILQNHYRGYLVYYSSGLKFLPASKYKWQLYS